MFINVAVRRVCQRTMAEGGRRNYDKKSYNSKNKQFRKKSTNFSKRKDSDVDPSELDYQFFEKDQPSTSHGPRGYNRGHNFQRGNSNGRPPHLQGREIGMYYAQKSKAKTKQIEEKRQPTVKMDTDQLENANFLLNMAKTQSKYESIDDDVPFDIEDTRDMKYWSDKTTEKDNKTFNQKIIKQESLKQKNFKYLEMLSFRKQLPAHKMRGKLLSLLEHNQVILVTGETGCGKTTQVPQFILDNAIENASIHQCRIICTQPRRISAISVAERVSAERGELCGDGSIASSCGYQIRLETRYPRDRGSILFCTTGVVLQWLKSKPLLQGISHIVLDEIHERDVNSDFLLTVVKDIIKTRQDIKIILMSATMNSDIFAEYFDQCPLLHIPGFTFPVTRYYLEDIMTMFPYKPSQKAIMASERPKRYKNAKTDVDHKKELTNYLNKCKNLTGGQKFAISTVSQFIEQDLEYDLIISLIKHIVREGNNESGAILIFVQGWAEISNLNKMISNDAFFSPQKFKVIPLHSMIPTKSQRDAFEKPPKGTTKIVVATQIAETSITINDIVHVIDCGKIKTTSFDIKHDLAMLKSTWISRSNASQRRGRAGRVQNGYCYHLYTKLQEEEFAEYQVAEILRTPLDNLCLQVRYLKLGYVNEFLPKVLESPSIDAMDFALEKLKALNAIDHNQHLTPLGYHLAKLPVEPQIGKMILLGAMFGCINPILTVAAYLSFRDPFHVPMGKERLVDEKKQNFLTEHNSDHMMMINVFDDWEYSCSENYDRKFCHDNFLSFSTLNMLKNCKKQFAQKLNEIGFLHTPYAKDRIANTHSDNSKIVNAIVCAGLYPNVVKIIHKQNPKAPPQFKDKSGMNVKLHGKSVNSKLCSSDFSHQWLCYYEKMKTFGTFLFDSCEVTPYPLLFFGGEITVQHQKKNNIIKVDDWITFKADPKIATLVKKLRRELDNILEKKIRQPDVSTWEENSIDENILNSIIELITCEYV